MRYDNKKKFIMPQHSKVFQAISFAFQFGFTVAIPLLGGIGGGAWLDSRLDTSPTFILFGATVGFAIAAVNVIRLLLPFFKDN